MSTELVVGVAFTLRIVRCPLRTTLSLCTNGFGIKSLCYTKIAFCPNYLKTGKNPPLSSCQKGDCQSLIRNQVSSLLIGKLTF
jgi:hypothetical protein